MSARRLLVLCYFYPPLAGGGVHRVLSFTRHLPRHGWACTVVCAGPDDYWVTDDSLTRLVPREVEVVRVTGGSALSAWLKVRRGDRGRRSGRWFGGLRRLSDFWLIPDSYVGWARRARRVAEDLLRTRRFDAVLSSSPPDSVHLAALELHRRHALPWVADFRDPWVSLHFREPPSAWHRTRQAALERSVLEGADVVLAASRTHADRPGARSDAHPRRVVHLPNGFEPLDGDAAGGADENTPPPAPPATSDAADVAREGTKGVPTFDLVFTGTLSQMPDTEVFLDALHDVLAERHEARRRLRATLAGPYDTHYEDRAVSLSLKGIVDFPGPVSHARARELQRAAGALLLWKPRNCPTMVPGKTYEYLDAGRPVIAVLEGDDEAAALVRRAGGTVVAPNDRAALAAALGAHYAAWRAGTPRAAARPEWLDEYTRERLARRLAGVLDGLAGTPR